MPDPLLGLLTDEDLAMARNALAARAEREESAGKGYGIVRGLDIPTNMALIALEIEAVERQS